MTRSTTAPAHPTTSLHRYSPGEPLLLLAPYASTMGGGGAVLLNSALADPEERRKVVWTSPTSPAGEARAEEPSASLLAPGERPPPLLQALLRPAPLANRVLELAARLHARAVWAVMHGVVVPLAAHLATCARLPLHLTVHDDPAFGVALRSRRHLLLTPLIERAFARAMAGAASVDVVCEGMAERYRSRYGVSPIITHRCMPGPLGEATAPGERELSVGVLGNTYSHDQLRTLSRALANAAQLLGMRGTLVLIGQGAGARLAAEERGHVAVQVLGHVPEREAVSALSRCFLLYLNYPFGRRDAVLRTTSFPTKLTTYVQAGRPLLIHAPPSTSLAPLLALRPYVHPWTSMEPGEGGEAIAAAWKDEQCWRPFPAEAESVRARYFDERANRARLFQALNQLG